MASLSGHGLRLRLAPGAGGAGVIRLPCREPPAGADRAVTAPNGTRIEWVPADPPVEAPPLVPEFVLTRAADGPPPGRGRAGMIYRDLIPGRLGGRFIASHIYDPGGRAGRRLGAFPQGPLPDDLLRARLGARWSTRTRARRSCWPPGTASCSRRASATGCWRASPGLEVVEIGCPALHETLADHDMALPTGRTLPRRDFDGQVFLRHVAAETPWTPEGENRLRAPRHRHGRSRRAASPTRSSCARPPGGPWPPRPRTASCCSASCSRARRCSSATEAPTPSGDPTPSSSRRREPWGLESASPDLRLLWVTAGQD